MPLPCACTVCMCSYLYDVITCMRLLNCPPLTVCPFLHYNPLTCTPLSFPFSKACRRRHNSMQEGPTGPWADSAARPDAALMMVP